MQKETRVKVYNTFAVPMITYGCKNWALKKSDKRRIAVAEMKFTRRMVEGTLPIMKKYQVIKKKLKK